MTRLFGRGKDDDEAMSFRRNKFAQEEAKEPEPATTPDPTAPVVKKKRERKPEQPKEFLASPEYIELKVKLHQQIIEQINLSAIDKVKPDEIRPEITAIVLQMLSQGRPLNVDEKARIVDDIIDELFGFGPLEPLLKDETVSDILVNRPDVVFVERRGLIEETNVKFKDDAHLLRVINRIVDQVGRRIDESQPLVDARLQDGSRVNAVIPPIALDGPNISIRKFSKIPFDFMKLVEIGSLTRPCADLCAGVVKCRKNVLISGGTGTGKTTFLNAMSRFIGGKERIVTIEDAAELQLQQRHVVRLETRPSNLEGRGEVNQRDLVKNALRMRPDRIVLGEVRAGEAFDMLQAMNTGHDGSLTTVHANTPRDALSRIEQMVSMTGLDLPPQAIRGTIASAIDVVIQLTRFSDGSRRVVAVSEVTGMEGDVITMQEIYAFKRKFTDEDGRVIGTSGFTGVRPYFFEDFQAFGVDIPTEANTLTAEEGYR